MLHKRTIAVINLLFLSPAALFMMALIIRGLPLQSESARTAQQIVMWYADRFWTLWVLLICLPLFALIIAGVTLLRVWKQEARPRSAEQRSFVAIYIRPSSLVIAVEALAAAIILGVVAIHMLMN